jgi:acetyltransferase-like isoleucine patch superfamily enzyme
MDTDQSFFVHQTAEVSQAAEIGSRTYIWNHAQVREGARIGSRCILGKDVYIDFGVQIGNHVKIQNGAFVYHGTTLEDGVFVGPGVIFTNDKNPRSINSDGTVKTDSDWEVGPIQVSYGASIGAGAIILPNVTIGRFAMVGAGAIVVRNVPDYAIMAGNPARQIGFVCHCGNKLTQMPDGLYRCNRCGAEFQTKENVLVMMMKEVGK